MKTKLAMLAITAAIVISGTFAGSAAAQDFSYKAEQDCAIGHRDGQLSISDHGLVFTAKNGKDVHNWPYQEIKLFEILSPRKIRIWTYEDKDFPPGKAANYTFKIVNGELSPKVSDFVSAHVTRPMVSSLAAETDTPTAQFAVEHLHRFGGCQGALKVYRDHLVFEALKGHDSRSWRWTDVRSISKLGPNRIEILTHEPQTGGPTRSYNFELKGPLPDQIYELIWARVFRPSLPSKEGADLVDVNR